MPGWLSVSTWPDLPYTLADYSLAVSPWIIWILLRSLCNNQPLLAKTFHLASRNLPIPLVGRQSGIAKSGPCLGGLGLSPVSLGSSLFWNSVYLSIKLVVVRREVGLSVLKLVVISFNSLFPTPPTHCESFEWGPLASWGMLQSFKQCSSSFSLTSAIGSWVVCFLQLYWDIIHILCNSPV